MVLWLTGWREGKRARSIFWTRLSSLSYEVRINFKGVGNHQHPFQIRALEILMYDEPLIHDYPILRQKIQQCLYTTQLLNAPGGHQGKVPADGQALMKDLFDYLANYHAIKVDP